MFDAEGARHDDIPHALRVDHLRANLGHRAVRAGSQVMLGQALKFVLALGSTMSLARLLTVSDFGLVAMAGTFLSVADLFTDLGLTAAAVQKEDLRPTEANTLFWLNLAGGALMALLSAALAPALAWFFQEPRLLGMGLAFAAIPLVNGLGVQPLALLRRQMRFLPLAILEVACLAAGIAAALLLAWRGAGFWALAAQPLATTLVRAAGAWMVSGWCPGLPGRLAQIDPLVRFGLGVTGFRLVTELRKHSDTMLLGRWGGPKPLGVYNSAFNLMQAPFLQILAPLSVVVESTLSRLQNDPGRYRACYRHCAALTLALTMPLVVFVFVEAETVVLLLFGEKWLEAAVLYRVLAPTAFVAGHSNMLTNWVFLTRGDTGRQFRWTAFTTLVLVLAYAVGLLWGAVGVAAAHSIITCGLRYPSLVYCFRGSPVRVGDVFTVAWRPAFASLGAGALLFAAGDLWPASFHRVAVVALEGLVFLALLLLLWLATPGGWRSLADLALIAHGLRPGHRSVEPAGRTVEPAVLRPPVAAGEPGEPRSRVARRRPGVVPPA